MFGDILDRRITRRGYYLYTPKKAKEHRAISIPSPAKLSPQKMFRAHFTTGKVFRGCFATASNYGVRRCITTRHDMNCIPSVIGWCDHRHAVMKKSEQTFSTTATTPTAIQLCSLYSHQRSQLVLERYRCNTKIEQRKRLFSGTTSDKNDKDDGAEVVGSGDNYNIDRSKFTKEVKIEMPNVGDNVKGEYCALARHMIRIYKKHHVSHGVFW